MESGRTGWGVTTPDLVEFDEPSSRACDISSANPMSSTSLSMTLMMGVILTDPDGRSSQRTQ